MSASASEYGDDLSVLRKVWEYAGSKLVGLVYRCRTKKIGMYNRVAVRNRRLVTPRDEVADYEAPLIEAIRGNVSEGDDVLVVGGGLGVSSVVAARQVGDEGSVVTYEGSEHRCRICRETAGLNGVADRVTVKHGVVGDEGEVFGDSSEPAFPVADLPPADAIVADCEGAELGLLGEYPHKPSRIVVETHGCFGSPTAEVESLLQSQGYDIVQNVPENADQDVRILVAV